MICFNPVSNGKYWFTPMNNEVGDIIVRLKQVLLSNVTMMNIDKKNTLQKICNKIQVEKLGARRISNKDIYELLEKRHRRDKLDTHFDIQYNH